MYAKIIPNSKTKGGTNVFTYLVPPDLENQIQTGQLVMVPFGAKKITGIVIETISNLKISDEIFDKTRLKPLISLVESEPVIDKTHLLLAHFIAEYYLCDLSQAIFLMLPRKLRAGKKNIRNQTSPDSFSAPFCHSLVSTITFTPPQKKAFSEISQSLNSCQFPKHKIFLLHGVTGSGKTEIYLALAKKVLSQKKQSIILVPEIAITSQVVDFFRSSFGNRMAVFHSHLPESQKLSVWEKCRGGEIDLVIGPRSALFLPLKNLGLIVMDEEQDPSYKSDQTPRYHARTVAEKLAELTCSTLVFGSATPSIETYFRAQNKQIELLELKERYRPVQNSTSSSNSKPLAIYLSDMPEIKIVDMRNEFHFGNKSVLSMTLQDEIQKVLKEKRQVFLYMNRRGAATFVLCRDCGYVELCPKCEIPLTLHFKEKGMDAFRPFNSSAALLLCHHCSTRYSVSAICPRCSSLNFRFFGAGTQKVELETKKLFPKAKITRLDLDTVTKPEIIYNKMKNSDIVVGTQLVAKNWDLPKVDLVGIISADVGLNLPDFRSAENTFQALMQVAGRAGRRERLGRVVIQTYDPENPVIQAAAKHDYLGFYTREIVSRRKFCYPPFSRLMRLVVSHPNQTKAKELAEKVLNSLKSDIEQPKICKRLASINISIPFYPKLHNKFRYQITIKFKDPNFIRELSPVIRNLLNRHSSLSLDIDPVSLL